MTDPITVKCPVIIPRIDGFPLSLFVDLPRVIYPLDSKCHEVQLQLASTTTTARLDAAGWPLAVVAVKNAVDWETVVDKRLTVSSVPTQRHTVPRRLLWPSARRVRDTLNNFNGSSGTSITISRGFNSELLPIQCCDATLLSFTQWQVLPRVSA
ncbi:hypothetical protein KQX54_009708 [Cotesia glomerata]|uniref:Uncharacterized protein n=1 Tax=Cotesia glomerata TaxID=32391 RepID=A0AAV7J1W3_COTGL|nr:hypothetical protein KQX54_009708 [Cotesia glomerata]